MIAVVVPRREKAGACAPLMASSVRQPSC